MTHKKKFIYFIILLSTFSIVFFNTFLSVYAEEEKENKEEISETEQEGTNNYYIASIISPYTVLTYHDCSEENFEQKESEQCQEETMLSVEMINEETKKIKIEYDDIGFAYLVFEDTEKVLTVPENAQDGDFVYIMDKEKEQKDYQKWVINGSDDDCIIMSAENPNCVLTVDSANQILNTHILLKEENSSDSQRFTLKKELPEFPEPKLISGFYTLHMSDSDLLVTTESGKADVFLYPEGMGGTQQWGLTYDDNGFAILQNADTNEVLAVRDNEETGESSFVVEPYSSEAGQRWTVQPQDDGGVILINFLHNIPFPNEDTSLFFLQETNAILSEDRINMDTLAQGYTSKTPYVILIDSKTNHVGIYVGSACNRKCMYYWSCVTGASTTPTRTGEFEIYRRQYYFNSSGATCYYATEWFPCFYFHSILYYQDTWDVYDATMGANVSHGCVRLNTEHAKWIYDNIPDGTCVMSY